MYLEFFDLSEKPFGLTPDPKFLFFSEKHREALDHLLYGIHQKEGFVIISGDTGTGKTTLCRALLERVDPQKVTTSVILNPLLSEEELLRAVLEDFGLPAKGTTRKELVDELHRFLLKALAAGKTAVLIIDEAQKLSAECLEQVRLLSNLETDKEKLIQIILAGGAELLRKLEEPELRHLQQRISLRYHLEPLNRKETKKYVQHRLNTATADGNISFEKRTYDEIYRFSRGVPRIINMIAERSLLAAYLAKSKKIKRGHVLEGRQSVGATAPGTRPGFFPRFGRHWQPALLTLLLVVTGIAVLLFPPVQQKLRRSLDKRFTQASYAPAKYSGLSVQGAIPAPEPAMIKKLARTERQEENLAEEETPQSFLEEEGLLSAEKRKQTVSESRTVSPRTELASPLSNSSGQGGVQAGMQPSPKAVGLSQKGFAKSKAEKEEFPQYLLEPPYIYTVQIESFKKKEVATARMQELKRRGFNAWLVWIDLGEKGIWYRVLLGKYEDKSEARARARHLASLKEFPRARQIATHKESATVQQGKGD